MDEELSAEDAFLLVKDCAIKIFKNKASVLPLIIFGPANVEVLAKLLKEKGIEDSDIGSVDYGFIATSLSTLTDSSDGLSNYRRILCDARDGSLPQPCGIARIAVVSAKSSSGEATGLVVAYTANGKQLFSVCSVLDDGTIGAWDSGKLVEELFRSELPILFCEDENDGSTEKHIDLVKTLFTGIGSLPKIPRPSKN